MVSAETGDLKDPNLHSQPMPSTSPVPILGEGFREASSASKADVPISPAESSAAARSNRRRLFGLIRRKNGEIEDGSSKVGSTPARAISPHASTHPYGVYGSPSSSPHHFRTASPGVPSPASSQIFERDVQETSLPAQASSAIPAHIQTEDHIPAVLEASSLAITDDHLDPDDVEIVMHSAHQSAAVTVTGGAGGASEAMGHMWSDELVAHPDREEAAWNYGALDSADVRRLSFISFADVVQAEHVDHAMHSEATLPAPYPAGLSSAAAHRASANRSPSPIRSPGSSHAMSTTPPTSMHTSSQGLDASPRLGYRGPGSPTSAYSPPHTGGELTIETMRQALRKTGSGDLSGFVSQPVSAVSGDDAMNDGNSWKH